MPTQGAIGRFRYITNHVFGLFAVHLDLYCTIGFSSYSRLQAAANTWGKSSEDLKTEITANHVRAILLRFAIGLRGHHSTRFHVFTAEEAACVD
jgi:hypothetical protein